MLDSGRRNQKVSSERILNSINSNSNGGNALIIEEGKQAHDVMKPFHDWLLTSINPEPPKDAESNERNNNSNCIQPSNPNACHKCALDSLQALQMSPTEKNTNIATWLT